MLLHLRVGLPDRPGALATVAGALAVAGADIVNVTVLDREGGRVIDDFHVAWPRRRSVEYLVSAVTAAPEVSVLGVRAAVHAPEALGDLHLIEHMLADPDRALETFTDMVPQVLGADWAAVIGPNGQCRYRSTDAPPEPRPPVLPPRPVSVGEPGETPRVAAPFGDDLVILGRWSGPSFSRADVSHLTQLLAVLRHVAELTAPLGAAEPAGPEARGLSAPVL